MIPRKRSFIRERPSREAKSIFIFCEGAKREYQYFRYFEELDSRINFVIYKLDSKEDNTPRGLLRIAERAFLPSRKGDEIWLVFDTDKDRDDSRLPQIQEVYEKCEKHEGWHGAQSNPCFEVWLYYHLSKNLPLLSDLHICSTWKQALNDLIPGGFNSRIHPIYIEDAAANSKDGFTVRDKALLPGSTEVYKLANSITSLIGDKLRELRSL